MKEKLHVKEYLFIGSMLFGMLFGAGNLIFPVHLGQEAGANVTPATIGFIISAVGLPFLAIVAMGVSKSATVFDLANRVNKPFALFFTISLYLAIGPFFAIPRLAATSFEIGLTPFIAEEHRVIALALYSLFFFGLAWFLAKKPTNLLQYIGKLLNPIFLVVLGILLCLVLVNPMGSVASAPVQESYQAPFFSGILGGYETLDVLASLAFGGIVISTLKQLGVQKPRHIAVNMTKAGFVSIVLMALLYALLAYAGATSLGQFELSKNGGIALAQIAHYYLGSIGSVLLALIVFFGCLKTTIGLLTSVSETFTELYPKVSYAKFLAIITIVPIVFANVGLNNIIAYSIPVLMFLYPLAIVLVLLALSEKLIGNNPVVYQWTIGFTMVAAFFDLIKTAPDFISQSGVGQLVIEFASKFLPFYNLGMGWIVPMIVGLVIGFISRRAKTHKSSK